LSSTKTHPESAGFFARMKDFFENLSGQSALSARNPCSFHLFMFCDGSPFLLAILQGEYPRIMREGLFCVANPPARIGATHQSPTRRSRSGLPTRRASSDHGLTIRESPARSPHRGAFWRG